MSSLRVQGVLFDLDGVLIDSTAGVTRVWRDWGIRQGLDPSQTAHAAHGRRAIDTIRLLAPQLDAEAELRDLERREIAESHDVSAFAGAARLLESLPPQRWAIVTSGTRDLATHRLRTAGLPVPQRMITGTDIGVGKVVIEAELLDGQTNQRVCAAMDARAGTKALRTKFNSTWGDARLAFEWWGQRTDKRLMLFKQGDFGTANL